MCSKATPFVDFVSKKYANHYRRWLKRLNSWARGQLGYVTADVFHLWNGSDKNRQYRDRIDRLSGYDPDTDMAPNPRSGLPEWTEAARKKKPAMIAAVEEYFTTRLEDQ